MLALVTGGNGHLGVNLVSLLRARGHAVRASVRSMAVGERTKRLRAIPGVELVEADVRNEAQMLAALAGADTLFHVAAVFSTTEKGRDAEILETAVRGTEIALRAASRSGVRRVILTSSVATLPLTQRGAPPATEDDWATDLRIPYFRAKVESEKLAWALAKDVGIEHGSGRPGGGCREARGDRPRDPPGHPLSPNAGPPRASQSAMSSPKSFRHPERSRGH